MSRATVITGETVHPGARPTLLALVSYLLLAILQTWPLARHLSTHLTGVPGGDTGVYVWNTWIFRYELVDLGHSPFSTAMVLALTGRTPLSLHNYTVFADLLALPMQPWLGVVATFNVVYLINVALAGFGMFLLARHVTGRFAESWIAGAMFACAPFLVARGTSHFSLAAAAPLPLFLYWLDRAWHSGRIRDALLVGLMMAWAAFSDPYYAIYCALLAVMFAVSAVAVALPPERRVAKGAARRLVDVTFVALVVFILVMVIARGSMQIGSLSISMRTWYTPMLALSALVVVRLLLTWRFLISLRPLPPHAWRTMAVMVASAGLLMAPELYSLATLATDGRLVRAPVLWRSSAPGVDLVTFFLPNPTHALAPRALVDWVAHQPGRFEENVMSLSWVGLAVIAAAWTRAAFRPSRFWFVLTIGFAWLAVGPFLTIAGYQTYLPTPWTFLRFVPVIGDARMPPRFGVLVVMGFSVIVATAIVALGRRFPERRRVMLGVVGIALAMELVPAPRPLYAATVPSIYHTIAADPRPLNVLELPFGIRDGLSSLGDFGAGSQFFQTVHHKALIGGYLSRVDDRTKAQYRQRPFVGALMDFSEGRPPSPADLARARDGGRVSRRGTPGVHRHRHGADESGGAAIRD